MTEREELLAIAERLDAWAGPVSSGQDAALAMRDAAKALRSAASTGPDVANQTVSAIIDEMANDWLTPNWHRQFRKDCENLIRAAIAALPAPAGESVTGWQEITEDNEPPLDKPLLLGWWREWPERKWEVEAGLYGSTKGGWNHGQATHWMEQPSPPTITRKSEARS